MTGRDWVARLLGVASLGASWGICLWLRADMPTTPNEPTALQALLVLSSFVLTSIGLLLILHGSWLLRWPGPRQRVRGALPRTTRPRPGSLSAISLADDRAARVDALTRRSIMARMERGKRPR